ncbi:hypothetical protein TIFTF001_038012 [Ficus carica]|nr:hypothetical protein TIFTF001_038012 [Ficus carica]
MGNSLGGNDYVR